MSACRLLLFPIAAFATFGQSAIEGLVLDPSGAAVPGATVKATLEATGAVRSVDTALDGRYRRIGIRVRQYYHPNGAAAAPVSSQALSPTEDPLRSDWNYRVHADAGMVRDPVAPVAASWTTTRIF